MYKLLFAILLGLVGAGIVHISILFLLPGYSVHDAWTRITAVAEPFETVQLDSNPPDGNLPAPTNPFIQAAACRFDLSSGAARIQASGRVPFWSMSIYDSDGYITFSISDDAGSRYAPDFVLHPPAGARQTASQPPAGLEQTVFVETGHDQGIVLLRAFVPDETWNGLARDFLRSLRCQPMRLP